MALDTLFFDLKINDMTDEQIKAIKSRLEKQLGANLDIGKQIQQSVERTGSTKLKIGADTSAAEAALKRITELLSNPTGSRNEISELNALVKTLKEISSIKDKQSKSDDATNDKEILNANKLNYAYERLFNAERSMSEFAKGSQTSKSFKDAISDIQILLFYLKEARGNAQETEKVLHGIGSASNVNRALRNAEDAVKGMQKERTESEKLQNVIFSLENALKRFQTASRALGNPQGVDAAIQKLREYIELARQASKSPTSTSEFLKSNSLGAGANAKDNVSSEIALARELQRQERAAQAASAAQERLANSQQRAAQATNSHANASVRLGNSLTGLVSITGDLRNQIGMLISAYTVEHLLKNVVEIGGEFEKQKLAMGSMLGSLEQADDIFNRMKNLALTSPFNFKDLSNYSRQLTAFGTPYKDLYDTTNRLADISAGLGGDMSRLVLAFSQVKAAAYLRGQEMRQFTEFGVSLPDLLAKKYSEAEHRIVTAGDVIERVSKRMVSFNDVKDVLWKSTDKGGQFYGMQNVLAQSTSGMASNLKDAIDTMYYDIAKSNSGMIKGTIKNITELVSHWRELTSVLSAGTIVYGAYRLIIAAHNRMIGMNTAETLKGVMAAKQEEASLLRRKALNEGLTEEEQRRLATSKKITASDVQSMAANKMINSDQLMRLVNSGRISPEMAASSAKMVGLNKVGRDYLATLIRLDRGISQNALSWRMFTSVFSNAADMNTLKINLLSRAQKAWLTGTRLLGDALSSLGSMFATILSPANIGMAGISLALSSIIDYNQRISQLKDANKQMIKDAEDSSKSIGKFLDENSIADISKKGASDIDNMVEEYRKQLEESPLDMSHFLANVDTIDNATEKLTAMREELEKIKKVDDDVSKNGNPFMASAQSMEHLLPDWMIGLEDKIVPIINLAKDKTLNGLFNDLESGAAKVNRAMADVTSSQLTEAIKNIKKESPDAAKELDALASSGANADEIVRRLIETGHSDAIVGIFGNLSVSDIGNYSRSLDNVKSKINDVIDGLGSKFKGINTGTATEEEVMEFKKLADGIAKSMNLSGDSLDLWNSKIEEMTSHSDKNLKYETYSWKVFTDNIKSIAEKKGIDLNKASQRQWLELVIDAKRQCGVLYPWMSNFLQSLISMANNNPIQFVIGIKSQVTGRQPLKGRGKQLAGNFAVSSLLGYDKLSTIQTDKDASDLVKSTYETYQEDMKNAKANRKSTKDIQAKWNQFKEVMSSEMNVDFIIGGEKIGGKKGHTGTGGGSKADQFLKDIQTQAEMIKKAVDVYKQGVQSGESQLASIGDIEKLGIFPKGTFDKITSEDELNKWYKNRLDSLVNALRKAKTSNERKKELSTLLADSLSFDRDEFKHEWDSKKQAIEEELKTITEQWGNYKSMYNITGNKSFSAMSAFGNGTLSFDNMGEVLKNMVQKTVGNKNTFDQLLGMTEQQIKAKYSGSSEILIELVNKYKEYTKSERSEEEKLYEDSVKSTMGYYAKIEQITADYNRRISIARKNNNPILANKLESEKQTKIDALNPQYMLFYQSALNFTKDKAREIGQALKDGLVKQMQDGTISAHDYAETIEKINKLLEESEKRLTPLQSFMDSGINGYFKNIYEAGQRKIDTGSSMQKQGMEMYDKYSQIFNSSSMGSQQQLDSSGKMLAGKQMMVSGQNMQAMGQSMQGLSSKGAMAIAIIDRIIKAIDQTIQAINQATQSIAEMEESFGVNTNKGSWLDFKSFTSGMSEFSSKAKAGWESLKSGDIAGAISNNISAYASIFTNFNKLHDKKLQNKIDDLAQQITEESLAIKKVEDALKYHLGNAAEGTIINNSQIEKVKEAQRRINEIKSRGSISIWDLQNIEKYNKVLKDNSATLKYMQTGNAYNYQRDLYEQQLEQLKKQKQAEEDKKKTDQSKINDYNSQIEEMETKITQFSEDLANSLYGIDIKGWASQFGDALFEAWQKGESGAEAFNKTAASILQNLVKSWFKTNVIENAFKGLQKDLFGTDGQGGLFGTNNDLTQDDISKIAADIMDAQGDITSKMSKLDELYAALEKKGIDLKGSSSSSTTNAISGVTEQEANIIAAYMDAIRQDTYNNRMNLLKIVENGVKIEDSPMMQAQLLQLQQIQSNTYRNMELVGDIKSLLTDFSLGNKKIYVN